VCTEHASQHSIFCTALIPVLYWLPALYTIDHLHTNINILSAFPLYIGLSSLCVRLSFQPVAREDNDAYGVYSMYSSQCTQDSIQNITMGHVKINGSLVRI
jgi:hypothetical protein